MSTNHILRPDAKRSIMGKKKVNRGMQVEIPKPLFGPVTTGEVYSQRKIKLVDKRKFMSKIPREHYKDCIGTLKIF